jgi:Protein of unknown function (DUF3987)
MHGDYEFGVEMETRLNQTGGLLRPAFGKARGAALRLSLILEWLWCAKTDMTLPPDSISEAAFAAAAALVESYFMPMAERVFGDAGASDVERNAATLARWIFKEQPNAVHVRTLLREVRLPGLRSANRSRRPPTCWLRPIGCKRPPRPSSVSRAAGSLTPSIPNCGGGRTDEPLAGTIPQSCRSPSTDRR